MKLSNIFSVKTDFVEVKSRCKNIYVLHWYKFEKYGPLTFNYIVLDGAMKYFASVLESELRIELKPLLGKK